MNFNRTVKVLALILMAAFAALCVSGCAATGTTDAAAADGTAAGGGTSMIIMLVIMVAVFYFLMIRPEKKKKQQAEDMRSSLSVGDEITTIGGLMGKIVAVTGSYIVFETGEDRVRIQVAKWAISTKGKQTEEKQA